jgi:hypothetical protein
VVSPERRILTAPGRWQQLAVVAHFADGEKRDVTRLSVYESSDATTAVVNENGLVEFQRPGEIAVTARYLDRVQTIRLLYIEPKPGFTWPDTREANFVDRHVFAKLRLLQVVPSDLCTDSEFLRRASLDLCARLPTPDEVKAFLASKDADKRAKLVDALLRDADFVDYWTMKWMTAVGSSRQKISLKGVETYRAWMRQHVARNTPFDQVVRDLLTATGNTHRDGPANYFLVVHEPEEMANLTAELFLGVKLECARCHNHPRAAWTADDHRGLTAFFAGVTVQTDRGEKPHPLRMDAMNVSWDVNAKVIHPRTREVVAPRFPGSDRAVPPSRDPRSDLATWLTAGDNPFFARAVVNRVWFQLMGRGIVDPIDDMRDSNPPANDELLDALARDFVESRYDVKHVIRTIMLSRTYQLGGTVNAFNRDDTRYFSRVVPKMPAPPVLLDMICQATEVPEKYEGMAPGSRSIHLADSEALPPFLQIFGRPVRTTQCEGIRDADVTMAQALHLFSGDMIQAKLAVKDNRVGRLLAKNATDEEILNDLVLATLSRMPKEMERKNAFDHVRKAANKRQAWEDVLWALLNTKEFLYRH